MLDDKKVISNVSFCSSQIMIASRIIMQAANVLSRYVSDAWSLAEDEASGIFSATTTYNRSLSRLLCLYLERLRLSVIFTSKTHVSSLRSFGDESSFAYSPPELCLSKRVASNETFLSIPYIYVITFFSHSIARRFRIGLAESQIPR